MNSPPPPPDARTRILAAAQALVRDLGVARLTLEATARAAGVSKGGLLHHFGSKEALLAGMMAHLAATIRDTFGTVRAAMPLGPYPTARAVVTFALSVPQREADDLIDRISAVLMAAHHHDPALLTPVRAVIGEIREAMQAEGTPQGPAAAVMAVKDGLILARMFGIYRLTEAERAALHATLAGLLTP
jgi:AcrR family transcriptional regulator